MSNLFSSGGAGNVGFSGETQQSLKFNDDESQYLSWTPASAGNRKTWTWSAWVKRSSFGAVYQMPFGIDAGGGTNASIYFYNDNLRFGEGATTYRVTNAVYRDPSSWYHIVFHLDTTQATASDRIKIWVNGQQVTSFSTSNNPSLNADLSVNNTSIHAIGAEVPTSGARNYFDGYLSDINFIDGQALDASSFGETVDGYWKKKDYTGTYGTNGFRLTFEDDVVSEGFNCITYRGTGATQSISGLGFEPDFVWIKDRTTAYDHHLFDTVRGGGNSLYSNDTVAENTYATDITFDADGFTVADGSGVPQIYINKSGDSFVAWAWDAGSGSAASNTDGTITSSVKANPDYGFSIVSYTGNSTTNTNFTVGHGLSQTPDMVIIKNRGWASSVKAWEVWHKDIGNNLLALDSTSAVSSGDYTYIMGAAPTSTTFSVRQDTAVSTANRYRANGSYNYIAYCFNSVAGYSSIGSYSGTGAAGNAVTGLGFEPAWLMIKRTDGGTNGWMIYDNTRDTVNNRTSRLKANASDEEDTGDAISFDSDGFTLNATGASVNGSSNNYIYMAFADTREAAFWKDVSGQGNHWTPNNLDYRDSLIDSPANNFAVLNPLDKHANFPALSEGNLKTVNSSTAWNFCRSTIGINSGKWYAEIRVTGQYVFCQVMKETSPLFQSSSLNASGGYGFFLDATAIKSYSNGSYASSLGTLTDGDIIGLAYDYGAGTCQIMHNGTLLATVTSIPTTEAMLFTVGTAQITNTTIWNFGQDSTFAGATTAGGNQDDNGIGDFKYAPPSGYLALCTANLPEPTIVDGSEHFNTVLYTGDNADRNIDVGFKSDFVWIKQRSSPDSHHRLFDSVRGDGQTLFSSLTNNEADGVDDGVDFAYADGFNIDAGANVEYYNGSGRTYASWNWKAGGTAVLNEVGTIDSQVSANTDAGFSIVSWAGDGTNQGATVGHSLGVTPSMIIVKSTDSNAGWNVWHKDLTNPTTSRLVLNDTSDEFDSVYVWGSTAPDASTFGVGTVGTTTWTNRSGRNYIAYVFANTEGYLKAGSYTGNGSTDGTFVYTGFRPAFVIMKRTNSTSHWMMMDSERGSYNVNETALWSNLSNEEYTGSNVYTDFTSNGFKLRNNNTGTGNNNVSGSTYIYLAFAETPQKFANAR